MNDASAYADWISRQTTEYDIIYPQKVEGLAATLDIHASFPVGSALPPCWHWILFNPAHRASELGHDGHARKGGFLPPINLPRRMWAGGRLEFNKPLGIGDEIQRTSTIKDVKLKEGKSGKLAFVTVRHEITSNSGGHWSEEHDIVYREAPRGPTTEQPVEVDSAEADWSENINPNPVLLFRYSALTFNGHRIHYDREYCIGEEGYPGLVVHGPLTATLLLELVRTRCPESPIKNFKFRALCPLFDTDPYSIHGRMDGNKVHLWALNPNKQRAMEAVAEI